MDTIQDKHVKNPRHNSINQSINKLYLPSNLQCSTEVLISSPPMILIGNQMVYTSELTRVLSKPRTAAVTKYSRGRTCAR